MKLNPPPRSGNATLDRWLDLLWRKSDAAGQISVSQLSGTLPVNQGGTGLATVGSPGQVPTVNPAGTGLQYSTPTGGAQVVSYIAGVALGGHRMVVLDASQQAQYASSATPAHISIVLGMTTGAAIAGAPVQIQTGGEITEPSWSWSLGSPVYLGVNGLLTQTPPSSGFSLVIGFPISATVLFINLREPVIIS